MKEGFTSNAASIRCVNGVWGKIEMKELGAPLYSSAFQGQYAVQDLRVSGSENGMAILCLKQAASLLSAAALEAGLPPLDADKAFEAVCRLCDLEREALYDGGMFIARLVLAADSGSLRPAPGENAIFTVKLWYRSAAPAPELTLEPTVDRVYGRYVEDPVFFRIGDTVALPDGGTMCALVSELLRGWNVEARERRVSTDELHKALREGTLREAFYADDIDGVGAVTGLYGHTLEQGKLTRKLIDTLKSIESGAYPAPGLVTVI